MKQFSIKNETEDLVKKARPHLTEITPHVAKDIFDIIRDNFKDEYLSLCEEKKRFVVNQWIGKAIMGVLHLRHNNERATITEDGHLIKSYTIFYQ